MGITGDKCWEMTFESRPCSRAMGMVRAFSMHDVLRESNCME